MENQLISYKKCNIQIFPHICDPDGGLLSTRLLHSLNRSMCGAIFPHKTTTSVCLGFFFHTSSMTSTHQLIKKTCQIISVGSSHGWDPRLFSVRQHHSGPAPGSRSWPHVSSWPKTTIRILMHRRYLDASHPRNVRIRIHFPSSRREKLKKKMVIIVI